MFASTPKVSPRLQKLIENGLFDRLPVTFSTFFFDQIKDWELLFPAEQSYYERLFSLIDRSDAVEIQKLFAPLVEAERKMGVNDKVWPKRTFTLEQVDLLNRNAALSGVAESGSAGIFAVLDPLLDREIALKGHPKAGDCPLASGASGWPRSHVDPYRQVRQADSYPGAAGTG